MANLGIEIEGMEGIVDALRELPDLTGEVLRDASDAALYGMVTPLAAYPPELPNQRYVRTGQLGRGWRGRPEFRQQRGFEFRGTLSNPTPYVERVQDIGKQERIFKGRWQTIQEVLRREMPRIESQFEAAMERLAALLAGGR